MLTREMLLLAVTYDQETGIFHWRNKISKQAHIGKVAGGVDKSTGYWVIGLYGVRYLGHRLAWFYVKNEWPPFDLDHEDLNKANNRIANLRVATRSYNMANAPLRSTNSSGFKGVSFDKSRGKWQSAITVNGRCHHLGRCSTAEDAAALYDAAARQHFGEFASTNVP